MTLDNYELTTIDYTLEYYLKHNELLEEDDIEWCNFLRKKIDAIMQSQDSSQSGTPSVALTS